MRRWMVGWGLLSGLLVAAGGAVAGTRLLVGSDGHGVQVDRRGGWRVVYSAAAKARYAQIAGRRITVECDQLAASGGFLLDTGGSGAILRAPARRTPLATGFVGGADYCYVARFVSSDSLRVMAVVPATARGALFLDQQRDIRDVEAVVMEAGILPRAILTRLYHPVPLPSARAIPPGHRLGLYWHAKRAYAAQRDRRGTLLFFGMNRGVVTTNLYGQLTDPALSGRGPYLGQTGPAGA